jgi:hypothetical protein
MKNQAVKEKKHYKTDPQKICKNIPEQFDVNVHFEQFKSTKAVCNFLNSERSRNIVLWYIGCYGLKQSCVSFYREEFILPLLLEKDLTKFWLVDLTAWFGLKDKRGSILKDSRICKYIEKMDLHHFEVIKASKTLKKIKNFDFPPLVAILKESMKLGFVTQNSAHFPKTGISVQDIFGKDSPLLKAFSKEDTGKFYSSLQYVEACFIVQTILERFISNTPLLHTRTFDIQFILPNNEYTHYFDPNLTFQRDIHYIVAYTCKLFSLKSISLNIKFLGFPFGEDPSKRPYNGTQKDKTLKHLDFSNLSGLSIISNNFVQKTKNFNNFHL